MVTKKKRTSLDDMISSPDTDTPHNVESLPSRKSRENKARAGGARASKMIESAVSKDEIVRQTLYLPLPVFDQLRGLFFEEQRGQVKRRRMHDYFLEGINLLFKDRGLKSIEELTEKK